MSDNDFEILRKEGLSPEAEMNGAISGLLKGLQKDMTVILGEFRGACQAISETVSARLATWQTPEAKAEEPPVEEAKDKPDYQTAGAELEATADQAEPAVPVIAQPATIEAEVPAAKPARKPPAKPAPAASKAKAATKPATKTKVAAPAKSATKAPAKLKAAAAAAAPKRARAAKADVAPTPVAEAKPKRIRAPKAEVAA